MGGWKTRDWRGWYRWWRIVIRLSLLIQESKSLSLVILIDFSIAIYLSLFICQLSFLFGELWWISCYTYIFGIGYGTLSIPCFTASLFYFLSLFVFSLIIYYHPKTFSGFSFSSSSFQKASRWIWTFYVLYYFPCYTGLDNPTFCWKIFISSVCNKFMKIFVSEVFIWSAASTTLDIMLT